ncbi:MAG: phosphate acyltransferase PlsX [Eubacteriales bacterium]
MRICVDAMGGDNAPGAVIEGVAAAIKDFDDITLVLTGKKEVVQAELDKHAVKSSRIEIVDCREVIEMTDKAVVAIKKKKDSSMVRGFELVRDGDCDVFLTAGHSGALVAGATLIVRRIKGVSRPAFCPVLPTRTGSVLLLDSGANVDCKPFYLAQWGVIGSAYMRCVMDVENPRVGLINNGTEPGKGNVQTIEAYKLMEEDKHLNFKGNVEGREMLSGDYDVVVADGFVGNVALKLVEGLAKTMTGMLKDELTKGFFTKLGALMAKPGFRRFKKRLDYSELGGALLLGVNGGVIKVHGSSDAKTFRSGIRQARKFIISGVVENIKNDIKNITE